MKVLVEALKCNIYIKEEIEEIVEEYIVTACICACTHAWHLACMHAPFVHMLVGVCTCVMCAYIHAHVTCACMHVACILFYKIFPHSETYSLFHSISFKKNNITVINRIKCQT